MADEKACGVIIYKNENNTRKYVIIRGVGIYQGYYGFPKGHMEPGETEQIIKREVLGMRIGKVMLISMIVLLLLSACEKSNVNASPEAPTESIVNASTEAPTESIGKESSGVEDDSQKMRIKASFQKIEYNIIENIIDRPAIYAEWVLRTCTYDSDNPYTEGAAICLITLMRVDTEKCVEDKRSSSNSSKDFDSGLLFSFSTTPSEL